MIRGIMSSNFHLYVVIEKPHADYLNCINIFTKSLTVCRVVDETSNQYYIHIGLDSTKDTEINVRKPPADNDSGRRF
jgi:hypothetical protein